jgi:dCMP deaminase
MKRIEWDQYFMMLAKMAATRSTCMSRPVGAVLVKDNRVVATGYNGAVPNASHCIDQQTCFRRACKVPDNLKNMYCKSNHAEANIIAQAAKSPVDIYGSKLYITLYPCYTCAKLLCSAGISRVYYETKYESVNVRDTFNTNFIEDGLLVCSYLPIETETLSYIKPYIVGITSKRTLKSE